MNDAEVVGGPGATLDRTRVTVAAGPLMAPVIARLIGIHAARADLPVDRLADALLIADALAARAPAVTEHGRVPLTLRSKPGRLEIRIGPLRPGGGHRLLAGTHLPEAGSVVERLADDVRVRTGAAGAEILVLRLGDA